MTKFFLSAAAIFATSAAFANPTLVGTYGKWSVYKTDGVCFAACQPKKSEGNYTQRGDIFLLVSNRPKDKVKGEVSTLIGYTFNPSSLAEILVDGKKKYDLKTTGEAAFVEKDQEVVNAMKSGNTLVIHGTSSRGTITTDTYSLSGFTKAYRAVEQACKS